MQVHVVNLGAPQKTIVVQVVKMCCAMSVIDDYKGNLKYNLRELSMTEEEREATRRATSGKPGLLDKPSAGPLRESASNGIDQQGGADEGSNPDALTVGGVGDGAGDLAGGTVTPTEIAGTLAGQAVDEPKEDGTGAGETPIGL